MAYSTQSDLLLAYKQDKIEQLLLDASTEALSDTAPQARLTEAIAKADGLINDALSTHYAVPVSGTVPVEVRRVSVELTYLLLQKRRPDSWTEGDQLNWTAMMEWLDEVRAGERPLYGLTRSNGYAEADVTRDDDAWARQADHDALTNYPYKDF